MGVTGDWTKQDKFLQSGPVHLHHPRTAQITKLEGFSIFYVFSSQASKNVPIVVYSEWSLILIVIYIEVVIEHKNKSFLLRKIKNVYNYNLTYKSVKDQKSYQ